MAVITNTTTSASINTAADILSEGNVFNYVVIHNNHASADLYVNIGATAASTGTIAGAIVGPKLSKEIPVKGRRVSVASGTASVPVAYHEKID